jgi:thiol-disulfide isomerase/thioredoxin
MAILQAAVLLCAVSAPTGGNAVLLDFTASWCGPCKQMQPTVERLTAQGYAVRQIDIDREPQLAAQFRITGVPCFVMVVDGRETGRLVGASSFEQLAGMFHANRASAGPIAGQGATSVPSLATAPRSNALPAINGTPLGASQRAAAVAAPAKAIAPELIERLLAATVRIKINDGDGNSVGTGTIIDAREGEALVLTCGHIFRDSKGQGRVTVDLYGHGAPQQIPARVIGYDLDSDVGFLSFRPDVQVVAARVAPPGYSAKPNDSVVSIGCNHGEPATPRVSRVTTIDKFLGPPNLQVAGQPVQGRSGGGLFNAEGYVIGVCNAADPTDDEGLYAALPAIHAELNQWALAKFCLPNEMPLAAAPPSIPARMPAFGSADPTGTVPTTSSTPAPSGAPTIAAATPEQQFAAAVGSHEGGAEVVCIIRSLTDPRAKSQVVVLDRATPQFLQQLADDRRRQEARTTTSFETSIAERAPLVPPTDHATPIVASPSAQESVAPVTAPSWLPTWKRRGE